MIKNNSLIRTIYLYTFSLLGLVLLIIGSVRFLDMGLKAFVFTRAEEDQVIMERMPISIPYPIERIESIEGEEGLSEEEKAVIKQWSEDYKSWQERSEKIDYVASRRHRNASLNLALILVGLPLYIYHWRVIRKELNN